MRNRLENASLIYVTPGDDAKRPPGTACWCQLFSPSHPTVRFFFFPPSFLSVSCAKLVHESPTDRPTSYARASASLRREETWDWGDLNFISKLSKTTKLFRAEKEKKKERIRVWENWLDQWLSLGIGMHTHTRINGDTQTCAEQSKQLCSSWWWSRTQAVW